MERSKGLFEPRTSNPKWVFLSLVPKQFLADSWAIQGLQERFWFRARYHGKGEEMFFSLTLPSVLCVNAMRSHGPLRDTHWSLAEVSFFVFQTLETPRNEAEFFALSICLDATKFELLENLVKRIAQECKKSTSSRRALLKSVPAWSRAGY